MTKKKQIALEGIFWLILIASIILLINITPRGSLYFEAGGIEPDPDPPFEDYETTTPTDSTAIY